jgi:hypothetical protein
MITKEQFYRFGFGSIIDQSNGLLHIVGSHGLKGIIDNGVFHFWYHTPYDYKQAKNINHFKHIHKLKTGETLTDIKNKYLMVYRKSPYDKFEKLCTQ